MNCILCGHSKSPECGNAGINGEYLCHPDSDKHPDCYVLYTVHGVRTSPQITTHEGKCCSVCLESPEYLTLSLGRPVCCHLQLKKEFSEYTIIEE